MTFAQRIWLTLAIMGVFAGIVGAVVLLVYLMVDGPGWAALGLGLFYLFLMILGATYLPTPFGFDGYSDMYRSSKPPPWIDTPPIG